MNKIVVPTSKIIDSHVQGAHALNAARETEKAAEKAEK
jgi:hypothetical protein